MTDQTACIGNDPGCPCQDGLACHYRDIPGSPGWPLPGKSAADLVCHEEQLEIWASEITDALSVGDFLRDGLSYDEVIDLAATIKREIKDIVTTAFTLKETP